MEVMTEQMHCSTLETSYSARSLAERWADPVWEDMKASFSSLRKQHLVCWCSHLRRHLRFSLILRTIEDAPACFLLLKSSLQLTWDKALLEHLLQVRQVSMEPFPFTIDDLTTELDLLKRQSTCCPNTEGPRHNRNGRRRTIWRQRNRLQRLWMIRLARQGLRGHDVAFDCLDLLQTLDNLGAQRYERNVQRHGNPPKWVGRHQHRWTGQPAPAAFVLHPALAEQQPLHWLRGGYSVSLSACNSATLQRAITGLFPPFTTSGVRSYARSACW
eukprot:1620181-Rhodomonas_salina.2